MKLSLALLLLSLLGFATLQGAFANRALLDDDSDDNYDNDDDDDDNDDQRYTCNGTWYDYNCDWYESNQAWCYINNYETDNLVARVACSLGSSGVTCDQIPESVTNSKCLYDYLVQYTSGWRGYGWNDDR